MVGLKGFCLVALRDHHDLVPSKAEFRSSYKSTSYLFSTATVKEKFDMNPVKYVPVFGGADVVLFGHQPRYGRRFPGILRVAQGSSLSLQQPRIGANLPSRIRINSPSTFPTRLPKLKSSSGRVGNSRCKRITCRIALVSDFELRTS